MFGEDDLVRSHKHRADAIINIVFISFGIILGRLWYLQIYRGDLLYEYSQENRLRKEIIKAPRGMVFSRNNQVVVYNVPRFDVVITPQYLSNKKQTIIKLAKVLNISTDRIYKTLKKNRTQASYKPIIIKKNVGRKAVAIIETEGAKLPGVSLKTFISREYTDKSMGGHVLGYISEINKTQLPKYRKRDKYNYKLGDFIGQLGIEKEFDLKLRGTDGYEFMEVDAYGRMKRHIGSDNLFSGVTKKEIKPGNNLRLTIDRDLQIAAYEALDAKDWVGSVVATDVETGEILAMVSRPSFDPSQFSRGITTKYWNELRNDTRNPMRARAIQEHYSPGSTFKSITAIAALEEGIIDEHFEVKCPGWFRLGRRKFHCWKRHGHGRVKVVKALRESCDVFFYKIATIMDIDVLAKYAKLLGFGMKSQIALPREIPGLIPTKEWKKKQTGQPWVKGETLSCVIGQSFVSVTPLQLAMAYASIANGGTLYRPHLVKEVFSNDGEVIQTTEKQVVQQVNFAPKTLDLVRQGLFEVVNERKGTAWWFRGRGIDMAGKTGTSQVVGSTADQIYAKCENKPYEFRHHGLFAAYAPYRNPKIAVSVIAEHACHGSNAGAPVARAVITKYMEKYMPELHKELKEEDRQKYLKMRRKEKAAKAAKEAKEAKEAALKKETTNE